MRSTRQECNRRSMTLALAFGSNNASAAIACLSVQRQGKNGCTATLTRAIFPSSVGDRLGPPRLAPARCHGVSQSPPLSGPAIRAAKRCSLSAKRDRASPSTTGAAPHRLPRLEPHARAAAVLGDEPCLADHALKARVGRERKFEIVRRGPIRLDATESGSELRRRSRTGA